MANRKQARKNTRRQSGQPTCDRRQMLKTSLAVGTTLLITGKGGSAAHAAKPVPPPVPLLDPAKQPKFVNSVLLTTGAVNPAFPQFFPPVINALAGGAYTMSVGQTTQNVGLRAANGAPLTSTTVWGYGQGNPGTYSWPGPTFLARGSVNLSSNVPVNVQWVNNLGTTHLFPIDTDPAGDLMAAVQPTGVDPVTGQQIFGDGIPIVTHIHGGNSAWQSDGIPDAWFTAFGKTGPAAMMTTPPGNFTYDNSQEGGTVWYHDHALGFTRQNVYAGMAGFYLVLDENEFALRGISPAGPPQVPTGPYEIGMAIQDRMFTATGQLYYPTTGMAALTPGGPSIFGINTVPQPYPNPTVNPEMFGNFMVVNGVAWPTLPVEPRQYRFRIINGCDSRFLVMNLSNKAPIYQIGTDLGLLNAPVKLSQLVLGPGERADIILDFKGMRGQVVLQNSGKAPFPKGTPVDKNTGQIMAFQVGLALNAVTNAMGIPPIPNPATLPANLRPVKAVTPIPVNTAVRTRKLLLFETRDHKGRIMPVLGTVGGGGMTFHAPITENPNPGDIEIWEIYNTTVDAHPIHLHLVAHQIINRQQFTATQDLFSGVLVNIALKGAPRLPAPNEMGWKDTSQMYPGEVTRIITKFDRAGLYVWHCHILSHEEHDMMRPLLVGPLPPGVTWPPM